MLKRLVWTLPAKYPLSARCTATAFDKMLPVSFATCPDEPTVIPE